MGNRNGRGWRAMMNAAGDALPRLGAGVSLRRLCASDLPVFQAYRADDELGRYQGWSPMTLSEARVFLDVMNTVSLFRPGEWTQIAIVDAESLARLGDIGLYLSADSRQAEMGFTRARVAQGRGLATAAVREALQLIFELTAVESVRGITDTRNRASIRLLERVGMSKRAERTVTFRGERCLEHVSIAARDARRSGHPILTRGLGA